jgi:putative flavoprotein involved in K+ transport
MPKAERFNTVIVGAGQAGLATGYYLQEAGDNFVIVDAGARVGDAWRNRWDSLRLFTEAKFNDLPGSQFPCEPKLRKTYFPTKDETADYIESYAAEKALPVRMGVKVQRLSKSGGGYLIDAGTSQFEANNVVVATGPFQDPKIPAFSKELDPSIVQVHSSRYRNPDQLPVKDTLVVGAATSGCQIGMDLGATRKVYLAGRDVGTMSPWVERHLITPIFPWLASRSEKTFLGKQMKKQMRSEGHPLVGFTYKAIKKAGLERLPKVAGVRDGKPLLENDQVLDVGAVVWCTGYSLNFSWIDLPIFEEDGYPRQVRGVIDDAPGLFFVGLVFLHSLSSQLIYGAQQDCKYVAEQLIARKGAVSEGAAAVHRPGLQAG